MSFWEYLIEPPGWAVTTWERIVFRPIVGFALTITAIICSTTALVLVAVGQ